MSEKLEPVQVPTDPFITPLSTGATNPEPKIEPQQDSHPTTQEVVEEPSYPTKIKYALIYGALVLSTFVIGFVGANASLSLSFITQKAIFTNCKFRTPIV